MKSIKMEIRKPNKLEAVLTIIASVEDYRFLRANPHRCPGNNWFYNTLDEIIERAEKEIFVIIDEEKF